MKVLISVSDKRGIVSFAKDLVQMGATIISTGGTYNYLSSNKIPVTKVDSVTGFPEILDGRVKTLHPKIHGGLLALRDNEKHMSVCQEHGIDMIDMVVVNLYPFREVLRKQDVSHEEIMENIDIGGVSLIRSASKNYSSVGVVVSPCSYRKIINEMKENSGRLTPKTRLELASIGFIHTSQYDIAITEYLIKNNL